MVPTIVSIIQYLLSYTGTIDNFSISILLHNISIKVTNLNEVICRHNIGIVFLPKKERFVANFFLLLIKSANKYIIIKPNTEAEIYINGLYI